MPRRVSLPGASELFRATGEGTAPAEAVDGVPAPATLDHEPEPEAVEGRHSRGSGRVRHDEKITVYVSSEELLALEQARLTLRARHSMAVDRGRIVREAILAAIADLDAHGPDSELLRRLSAP